MCFEQVSSAFQAFRTACYGRMLPLLEVGPGVIQRLVNLLGTALYDGADLS